MTEDERGQHELSWAATSSKRRAKQRGSETCSWNTSSAAAMITRPRWEASLSNGPLTVGVGASHLYNFSIWRPPARTRGARVFGENFFNRL